MVQFFDLLAISIAREGFYDQRAISSIGERRWYYVEKHYLGVGKVKCREDRTNINFICLKEDFYV